MKHHSEGWILETQTTDRGTSQFMANLIFVESHQPLVVKNDNQEPSQIYICDRYFMIFQIKMIAN